MHDAWWETVLSHSEIKAGEMQLVAVNNFVKDGCTLYTQSLIKAQIYQEDHKSSP